MNEAMRNRLLSAYNEIRNKNELPDLIVLGKSEMMKLKHESQDSNGIKEISISHSQNIMIVKFLGVEVLEANRPSFFYVGSRRFKC